MDVELNSRAFLIAARRVWGVAGLECPPFPGQCGSVRTTVAVSWTDINRNAQEFLASIAVFSPMSPKIVKHHETHIHDMPERLQSCYPDPHQSAMPTKVPNFPLTPGTPPWLDLTSSIWGTGSKAGRTSELAVPVSMAVPGEATGAEVSGGALDGTFGVMTLVGIHFSSESGGEIVSTSALDASACGWGSFFTGCFGAEASLAVSSATRVAPLCSLEPELLLTGGTLEAALYVATAVDCSDLSVKHHHLPAMWTQRNEFTACEFPPRRNPYVTMCAYLNTWCVHAYWRHERNIV